MTKGLIVVTLLWACQLVLGSEITILEAQLQKGDPSWGLYREIGFRAVNTFCFDEKLLIASFVAKNLHKVTPIMGNAPEGLGQQECPHKEFQLLDSISFKETLEEYEEGTPGGVRLGEQQFGIDPEEEDWMVHPDQNANKWELDRTDESPRLQAEIFHIAAQCAMEGMAVRNAAKLEMVRGGRGYNAGSQDCQKNR